jgi:thermitase
MDDGDEILVKFKEGAGKVSLLGARFTEEIEGLGVHVVKVPKGTASLYVDRFARHPAVEFAEVNGTMSITLDPNDPYDNTTPYTSSHNGAVTQWAWGKIQAYDAWNVTTGSSSVVVAVVDTGADSNHPDLAANLITGYNFVNNSTNAEDDNGHGTHVAGTIGAVTNNGVGVAGLSWSVKIMPVKVLNNQGSGSFSTVAKGIRWAADNGAKVINLSLGGGPSLTVKAAVDYAWSKGAVLACAAGNNGTSAKTYPAAYINCIAVAATDQNDAKASFSNYGAKWVDVAAPGVAILSTMPDTAVYLTTQYGYYTSYDALNGTSMATPHVAGLAALIWAKGACSTASCVRSSIEGKADPIPGTGTYWAYGRINAYNSVK